MNKLVLLILGVVMLALPLTSGPAAAKPFAVSFVTEAALKATCGKVGGDFLGGSGTGSAGYGCTKPCGTGNCSVECDPAKHTCTGQVPPQTRVASTPAIRDVLGAGSYAADGLEFSGADGFGSRHSGESGAGAPSGGADWDNGDFGQWHANTGGGVVLGGGIFATH